jgi:DUF4097 and DUF4098 domain-containing protein YvlB
MRKYLTRIVRGGVGTRIATPAAISLLIVLHPTGTAFAGSSSKEKEEKQTVDVRGESRIYVKNTRGKTIIVGRKDAGSVLVRAFKYVRAKDSKTAAKWMDELEVEVDTDGEQISVITRHPDRIGRGGSFWSFIRGVRHRAYVDYTIEVPNSFDAKVASTSGDIQITSLDGGVKLFGSSGDVFLKDIGGKTFVELSSGDIEVKNISEDLRVRMSSGDADVREIGGSLGIQGTSGDVEAYGIGGDADVELSSGSIVLIGCGGDAITKTISGNGEIANVEGNLKAVATSGDLVVSLFPVGEREYVLKTSSGDVIVSFDTSRDYGFLMEVATSSGSIEGDLDIKLDKISRKMLRGVVGSGDGRLYIETASGDIRIKQVGN